MMCDWCDRRLGDGVTVCSSMNYEEIARCASTSTDPDCRTRCKKKRDLADSLLAEIPNLQTADEILKKIKDAHWDETDVSDIGNAALVSPYNLLDGEDMSDPSGFGKSLFLDESNRLLVEVGSDLGHFEVWDYEDPEAE